MQNSEQAVADEGGVVVGWVPGGEPAATKLALAVLVSGRTSRVEEQKNCLELWAGMVNVPAADTRPGAGLGHSTSNTSCLYTPRSPSRSKYPNADNYNLLERYY